MPKKPAKTPARRAPKASRKKVWVHTFYLLQPVVQFFALIAVLLVFARCSPLASSTDRNGGGVLAPVAIEGLSPQAEAAAKEQTIISSLHDISAEDLRVISVSEMEEIVSNSLSAEESMDEVRTKNVFKFKRLGGLLIPLDHDQQVALFRDEELRLDISEKLPRAKEKARRNLFRNLQAAQEGKKLKATILLVLPDAAMRRAGASFKDLNTPLSVALGVPDEDKAYLHVALQTDPSQDNAALLGAALQEGPSLAILLE